jgi:hypothetical protein
VQKRFVDEARQCAARARAAAVFAMLILEPPRLPGEPVVAGAHRAPLDEGAAPPTRPSGRRRPRVLIELGGVVDAAPRTAPANSLVAGGASLRGAIGGRHLFAVVGLSGLSPVTLTLPGLRARVARVPLDLSLRAAFERGRCELAAELGVTATVLLTEGLDLASNDKATRLEFGIRTAFSLYVWLKARVAPFAAVQAVFVPRPNDLVVAPIGNVGTMPWAWLGGTLGAAVRFD